MAQRLQCQATILTSLRLHLTPDDWRETFWDSNSIHERLRVIFDSESGYLKITNDTWATLGGTSGVVQALRTACQSTTVLDISEREMDVTECEAVVEQLKSMPEVSSVIIGEVKPDKLAPFGSMLDARNSDSSHKLPPKLMSVSFAEGRSQYLTKLNQRLRARTPNLGEGRMYWENVVVTDYLREGDPYLLFKTETAKCIVQFYVEKEGHYEVKLRHCFTTSGSPSSIAMTLNGADLPSQWCCDQRVKDNFADEVIKLGCLAPDLYTMEIFAVAQIEDDSEIVVHYWLSNVYAPQRVEQGTDEGVLFS